MRYGAYRGARRSADRVTHLHTAASRGHRDVVRCLVNELGADINHATDDGSTVLYHAARGGYIELLRRLVNELGADVN